MFEIAAQLVNHGEVVWIYAPAAFGALRAVTSIAKNAPQIRERRQNIAFYNEVLFFDRREPAQAFVGMRHVTKPSDNDRFAWSNAFAYPAFAAWGGHLRKRKLKLNIDLDLEKNHVFVGGWRPLPPVEFLLRKGRFIFAVPDSVDDPVPNLEKMQQLRINEFDKDVDWVVYDKEKKRVIDKPTPGREPGTWTTDFAIITRAESPFRGGKTAVALSGCHGEGTIGASLLTTDVDCLKELDKHAMDTISKSPYYQAVVKFQFSPHKEDEAVDSITGMEVIDVAPWPCRESKK